MPIGHRDFFVKFAKVDKERRIVWGIAQAECVDLQDDYVTYPASVEAFTKWAGNVREMHTDTAIGKAVQVIPLPNERAIMVGAYISKGAEEAWQKVLDNTYTGFSIGGAPLETERVFKGGKKVRKITKYILDELSLVDTPANPKCVVRAITKRGSTLVATDVLGSLPTTRTASDVLSLHQEILDMSNALKKRVKIPALVTFNKSLGATDEVLVARLSDFTKAADGSFVLNPKAAVARIKKGEFDTDGYDSEGMGNGEEEGDGGDHKLDDIDFEGHADDAAKMHKSFCKMAGIDDNEAHYHNATAGRDDDGDDHPDADADPGEAPGAAAKSAARRRRNGMRKGATIADIDKIVAERIATMTKSITEQVQTAVASAAPRREAAGEVLAKGASTEANTGDAGAELVKRLAKAYTKRDELLNAQATDANKREREALVRELAYLETALTPAAAAEALALSRR